MTNNRLFTYVKKLALGLIVIGLACLWLYASMGIARQEFRLMRDHETCSGFIVDTWEDVDENEAGAEFWNYYVIYEYSLPDGREFTQSMSHSGRLKSEFRDLLEPYPIEVEYLPDNPTVSRIKGDGPNSIPSWLRTSVGYWALFPLGLLAIGIYLLWEEVSELRRLREYEKSKTSSQSPQD